MRGFWVEVQLVAFKEGNGRSWFDGGHFGRFSCCNEQDLKELAISECVGRREWHSLATTEEGVHCIGYDELVRLGAVARRCQSV